MNNNKKKKKKKKKKKAPFITNHTPAVLLMFSKEMIAPDLAPSDS
jgi:hypothetical protein